MNTSRTVTGRWGGSLLMIGGLILPTVSYFLLSDPALHPTSPSVPTPVLVTVHTPLLPTSPYSRVELQPTSGPSTMSAPQCGTRFPLISRVRIHRMYSSVCSCVICDNKQWARAASDTLLLSLLISLHSFLLFLLFYALALLHFKFRSCFALSLYNSQLLTLQYCLLSLSRL